MYMNDMSHRSVAEALYYATRQLRDEWVGEEESRNEEEKIEERAEQMRTIRSAQEGPLFWVPYVHYGI